VTDNDNHSTELVETSVWEPGTETTNEPPLAVSGEPAEVTGSPQVFRFVGRDPNGYRNIQRMYFLINNTASATTASCHGYYDLEANSIVLFNDGLTGWQGSLTPGQPGFVQNSQCRIDGPTSAPATGVANDLTMTLGIRLNGSFATAPKYVYLWVKDKENNDTGWVQTSKWNPVPGAGNRPPLVVGATPAEAIGSPQSFTVVGRDPDGFADIQRVYFLVNESATIPSATCHGYYDRAANAFYLYSDGLATLLGPLAPGAAGSLMNSQCTIHGASSTPVTGAGTDLTIRLGLTLAGSYGATAKQLFAWVKDNWGMDTGWVQVSNWLPSSGGGNQPPTVVSGTPAVATGSPQNFVFTGRDPNGIGNIQRFYFLINGSPTIPVGSCHGFYDRMANAWFLYNDTLTVLLGPLTPGAQTTIGNQQCVLDGLGTAGGTGTGTDLTVGVRMSLRGAFATSGKNVYLLVKDNDGNDTGWVKTSTWNP
jgi:hypothetical protein